MREQSPGHLGKHEARTFKRKIEKHGHGGKRREENEKEIEDEQIEDWVCSFGVPGALPGFIEKVSKNLSS